MANILGTIVILACCALVIRAIFKIKRHIQDQQDIVNSKNIAKHAFAFLSYGVVTAVDLVAQIISVTNNIITIVYNLIYALLLFSSLAILCLILWDLSKKPEDEPEERVSFGPSSRSDSMSPSAASRTSSINEDSLSETVTDLLRTKDTGRTVSVRAETWRDSVDEGNLIYWRMFRMFHIDRPEHLIEE